MISEKMQKAINDQINAELYSSYLYLAMSAHFESENLPGCASWMKVQAQEEVGHAMKFFAYLNERGGRVALQAVDAPPEKWESVREVFEEVLEHERKVTSLINNLVDLAIKESDHATNNMLQWFVAEQVEEEASAEEVLQRVRMVEESPGGLFMIDQALGQRQAGASAGGE